MRDVEGAAVSNDVMCLQGDALQQLQVEWRYKQVWNVRQKVKPEVSGESEDSADHSQAPSFDGKLQISIADNVPGNGFAPDVLY